MCQARTKSFAEMILFNLQSHPRRKELLFSLCRWANEHFWIRLLAQSYVARKWQIWNIDPTPLTPNTHTHCTLPPSPSVFVWPRPSLPARLFTSLLTHPYQKPIQPHEAHGPKNPGFQCQLFLSRCVTLESYLNSVWLNFHVYKMKIIILPIFYDTI